MDIFVVTVIDYSDASNRPGRSKCSNVWLTEKEAVDSILENHFDVWEGFTNEFAVIEKMEIGSPWTCEQVSWFKHERVIQEDKTIKHLVYESERPKDWEGITNLGIG